ncbi:MAG TPA: Mu transposase C-terminal domain-containing protein [Anaerolineae bacterium]|nr:Mu transposase C-terminal domain-containing protein [Anaerolineae bacterium]
MTSKKRTKNDRDQRNREIALFRYGLIAPLLFQPPAEGQLEAALRQIAAQSYNIPHSQRQRVSVSTLRRYLVAYQTGGFDALRPNQRADKGEPKAFSPEVLATAIALREEQPARTTPMLVELLHRHPDLELDAPINAHTLATHLRHHGKTRRLLRQAGRTYQRFEREHSNSLWQGDAMVGPWLPDPQVAGRQRRAHLFCFLDDHSRLIPHAEFFWDEKLPRLERVLKLGILRRGLPKAIYVDNGHVYASNQLGVACATLGIRRIHTAPYTPEAKGKQERFFETVRLQFMPEVTMSGIATLAELNESFWAWLACIYHQQVHSTTGQTPLDRFRTGLLPHPKEVDPAQLATAFLWQEQRKVRKDGTISLQGNRYQVGAHLAGRTLLLRFDPFDLSHIDLFLEDTHLGRAVVVDQGRQKHLAVQGMLFDPPPTKPTAPTVDYLAALRAEHRQMLAQEAGSIQFAQLTSEEK